MPKRAVINWFERRVFVKRLVAAGAWATGVSAFDGINLAGVVSDRRTRDAAQSSLDATAWQSYAIWGPWENSAL